MVEASPLACVVTDPHGLVISVNPGFARVTGFSGAEFLGRSLSLLQTGRHEPEFDADLWRTVKERGFWHGGIWNRLRNGEIRLHELSITAVRDQSLAHSNDVGMLEDVSERHQAQEEIRHLYLHDPLTGLANRGLSMELCDEELAEAQRKHHAVGLLFVDPDSFKPVNDRFGHAVGDLVLQVVATRVSSGLRYSDTLARLGGDEFVLLAPRCGRLEQLQNLAAKITTLVEGVAEEVEDDVSLSVSIGIARSPGPGVTVGHLLAADQAMDRPRNSARISTPNCATGRIEIAQPGAASLAALSPAG